MSKKKIVIFAAFLALSAPALSHASIGPIATTGDTAKIEQQISSILDQISILEQKPQLGGSGAFNPTPVTSSTVSAALPQPLGTTSTPSFAGVNITPTSTSSYIANLNGRYTSLSPSALSAAGTDLYAWTNAVYSANLGVVSSTNITIPAGFYIVSSTSLNVNNNGETLTLNCSPSGGTIIDWLGSGTSTVWNYGSTSNGGFSNYPWAAGPQNCTFLGPSQNGSSTFAVLGGANGAGGFYAHGNRVFGFGCGGGYVYSTNAWETDIDNNQMLGNCQNINYPGSLSGSGERLIFSDNLFGDCTNSTARLQNCENIVGANEVDWTNNSTDDGGVNVSSTLNFHMSGNYSENPTALGNGNFAAYYPLQVGDNTNVTLVSPTYFQDATTTTSTPSAYLNIIGNNSTVTISGGAAGADPNNNANTLANFANVSGTGDELIQTGLANATGTSKLGFTNFVGGQGLRPQNIFSQNTTASGAPQTCLSNGSSTLCVGISGGGGSQSGIVDVTTANSLVLETNNIERARITSGGNLEVGTSTANGQFDVAASSTIQNGAPASGWEGCYESWDAVNTSTKMYSYSSNGVWVTTSTKPSTATFSCQ